MAPKSLKFLVSMAVPLVIIFCQLVNAEEILLNGEVSLEENTGEHRVKRDFNEWEDDTESSEESYGGANFNTLRYNTLYTLNYYRSIQHAANMMQMRWSPYLASAAQYYAGQCLWQKNYPYSSYPLSGATISSFMFATTASSINASIAFSLSYRDCSYYNVSGPCYPGQVCGNCSSDQNCTQCTLMLWASSNLIGCGVSSCSPLTYSPYSRASLLVCYISPAVNRIGYYPYAIGPPCSMCNPYSYYCQSNLCCQRNANSTANATQTSAATTQRTSTKAATITVKSTTASATTSRQTTQATTTVQHTTKQATTTAQQTTTQATTTAQQTTTQATTTAQQTTNTATTIQATSGSSGTTASVTTGTIVSTGPATTGPATTGQPTTGPATTGPATSGPATTGQPTTAPETTAHSTTTDLTTNAMTTGSMTTIDLTTAHTYNNAERTSTEASSQL